MGRVLGPETLIRAREAQIGDLLVLSENRSRATAIVFEVNEDREPLLGMLEGDERPYLRRIDDDELCANLGSDWLIEPDAQSAAGPGLIQVERRAGVLVLTRSGWAMNFATSGADNMGRFSWEWRDLATGKQIARIDHGLVYDRWTLWAEERDRDRPDASPLLTHRAEATGRSIAMDSPSR